MRGAALAVLAAVIAAVAALAILVRGVPAPLGEPSVPPPSTPRAVATPVRPPPTAPATATPSPTPIDPAIAAAGIVVPQRSADLSMPMSARVVTVGVSEEDEVFTGELLVRVDPSTRQAAVDVAVASVERAEAAVDRARLQVEQLPLDASPAQREAAQADLRLAQAELRVAQTTLAEAELELAETELRAPFAGTVASIAVAVGEQAVAGQPIVSLGDLSSWYIQTVDLSELHVVRIAVGDRAEVTFDALPDLIVTGTVDQVQVRGSSAEGGVVFDAFIRPDEHHPQLRWNMSAAVRILPSD